MATVIQAVIEGSSVKSISASAPPAGSVIEYTIIATSGGVRAWLEPATVGTLHYGTQNNVFVGLPSRAEAATLPFAGSLTFYHRAEGTWGPSGKSWESGNALFEMSPGSVLTATARLLS